MQVTVDILEKRPDETTGIGSSLECQIEEAIALIRAGEAKAPGHAIGVVPAEWLDVDDVEEVKGNGKHKHK